MLMPTVFIAQFKVRLLELSNFFSNHCPIYLMAVNKKGPSGHADFVGCSLSIAIFSCHNNSALPWFWISRIHFILLRTVSRYWCVQKIKNATSKKGFLTPLCIIWHFRLWSFQGRNTKLERFLAKNQPYSNEITKFWELE